jgi:CTP-dependent riboflavin kinase
LTYRGRINGRYECGVIIPLVPNYPEQILEIVAPVHLKDALSIRDGDEVELDLEV